MNRVVIVIADNDIQDANDVYQSFGWGDRAATRALSADAKMPATHWGGCSSISDEMVALLKQPPIEYAQLIAKIRFKVFDSSVSDLSAAIAFFKECGLTLVFDIE